MSTFVACTDKASNQYLLDIAHGSRQNIPQKNVDLIGWSSNGKYLVFNKQIGPGNSKHIIRDTLIVYEISLNQAITYSLPQTFQEEFSSSEVRLSSDGKFIAFVAENVGSTQWSLFSLSGGVISKVRDYGSVNLPITQDFVWSSLSSKFVVGTTQATHDGPAFSEKIFLAQAISSTNQLVASSPSGLVFWEGSIEWSPTSDQFVIGLWEASFSSTPQACIFNSQTKKRRCIQAQKGINERFATWAPNGKNVAYVDLQSNLKIASTSFGNTKKLFVSVPETFAIYWRDIP